MLTVLFYSRWVVYVILAVVALATDWKTRRIPNQLTYSAAAVGLVAALGEAIYLAAHQVPELSPWWPVLNSILGGVFGFAVMFFLYLRNGVGGGDVKLMGAAGFLVGITHVVPVLMYSCLVGVAIGFAIAIWNGRGREVAGRMFSWRELRQKKPPEESAQPVPFGVAFAGGAAWAALMPIISM